MGWLHLTHAVRRGGGSTWTIGLVGTLYTPSVEHLLVPGQRFESSNSQERLNIPPPALGPWLSSFGRLGRAAAASASCGALGERRWLHSASQGVQTPLTTLQSGKGSRTSRSPKKPRKYRNRHSSVFWNATTREPT